MTKHGFKRGDHVRVAPHTDAFMRGMTHGFVRSVGPKWVTVEWDLNREKTIKFHVDVAADRLELTSASGPTISPEQW